MTSVQRVVAPNPGPYTGPGTNTWIVDAGPVAVVIDPGPDDDDHLAAIDKRLGSTTVGVVLVTHSHPDHLPLADRLAQRHHAAVRRYPELGDGDIVRVERLAAMEPRILFPGHWDPVSDAMAKLEEYRTHRLEREAQILAEVGRGAGTARELMHRVYGPDLGEDLIAAAEMTLRAHLKKLIEDGAVNAHTVSGEEVFERSVS